MRLLDVVAAPWAISPEMFGEIRGIYAAHLRGEKIDIKAIEAKLGRELDNTRHDPEVRDGVAIISLEGVLAKRANLFMQVSGGTSTQIVGNQIRAAMEDPNIKGIVLAIDSPGGTVDGVQELATLIASMRGTKPIVAVTDGAMASAAYWIGSAADKIFISSDTAQVGSIGVVASHIDISKREEAMGVKTTEVVAGKFKRIASQHGPLTPEGREDIQEKVDYLYSVFVGDVATNRGVALERALEMADGKVFIGQQAVRAGLVDGKATIDDIVGQIASGTIKSTGATASTAADEDLEMKTITIDTLKADHPAIVEALRAEGRTEGAEAERARIKSVEDAVLPGHEALIATMKFDGKTTGGEAALAVNKAEKVKRGDKLAALRSDGAQPAAVPAAAAPAPTGEDEDANAPIDERAKATWDKDAKVRAEFETFEDYLAFRKADAGGQIKVLKSGATRASA